MAKIEWKYLTGDLIVTVRGRDKNERFMTFEFTCYADEEVDWYDRLDALTDIAHKMLELRGGYCSEIVDIKEQKQ